MPRPSRKEERRTEILEAYGRCIAHYGVAGTTLERVAEEAGLARALIRHNVGNKEALLSAFLDGFLAEADAESAEFFAALPDEGRADTLGDWLFGSQPVDIQTIRITNALVIAAASQPELARRLRSWTAGFTGQIAKTLMAEFPGSDNRAIDAVANGIAAIYFNFDTMKTLGDESALRRTSRDAVARLIRSLAD